jgi:CheY-like chemotaxis protein
MERVIDVLLVEDDAELRDAVADVLRDQSCRVYAATDGQQALEILRAIVPDVIVTDLVMPRVNGWELCAAVRSNRQLRETPIVVLSAFGDVQPLHDVRMIRKPLDVHALVSLLDAVTTPGRAPS